MECYPLLFSFTNIVRTDAFAAGVATDGRALVYELDGSWWMSGVEPGGSAEHGENPMEAHQRFKDAFQRVLEDLAAGAQSSEEFAGRVREFFADKDRAAERRWDAARQSIRDGSTVEHPFDVLNKVTEEPGPSREATGATPEVSEEDSMPVVAKYVAGTDADGQSIVTIEPLGELFAMFPTDDEDQSHAGAVAI